MLATGDLLKVIIRITDDVSIAPFECSDLVHWEDPQRDQVEREVGGGIGMGNTCISMADSCQCMTKTTTIL